MNSIASGGSVVGSTGVYPGNSGSNVDSHVGREFYSQAYDHAIKIVGHPGFVTSVALAILGAITYYGINKYNNYQKIKAKKAAREAELKAQQEQERQAAAEVLFKKEMLIQACEQVDYKKKTNDKILDALFISEYSIPLQYPEGAAEVGYSNPSILSDEEKPAFDDKTEVEVEEIRTQIKTALESQGTIPLPNLLLSGVAGVGKSMLIEDLCKTMGAGFIKIPTGTFGSQISFGNEVKTLNDIIEVAESSQVPVYVMLDDGEGLFDKSAIQPKEVSTEKGLELRWENEKDRFNSNDIISQRRSALIQAIINLAEQSDRKISFALTTNRPEVVVEQFKNMAISIDIQPPGKQERIRILEQKIWKIFGAHNPIVGYFSSDRMKQMADKTEGFTGRNIVKMIEVLASLVKNDPLLISDAKIDEAIELIKPSVEAFRNKKV